MVLFGSLASVTLVMMELEGRGEDFKIYENTYKIPFDAVQVQRFRGTKDTANGTVRVPDSNCRCFHRLIGMLLKIVVKIFRKAHIAHDVPT